MVDHYRVEGRGDWFQLQSELVLKSGRVRLKLRTGSSGGGLILQPLEREIVMSGESSPVEYRVIGIKPKLAVNRLLNRHIRCVDVKANAPHRSRIHCTISACGFPQLRTAFCDDQTVRGQLLRQVASLQMKPLCEEGLEHLAELIDGWCLARRRLRKDLKEFRVVQHSVTYPCGTAGDLKTFQIVCEFNQSLQIGMLADQRIAPYEHADAAGSGPFLRVDRCCIESYRLGLADGKQRSDGGEQRESHLAPV